MTVSARPTVRCRAPAKVNLTLAVRGRLPDGFHEIESWVVQIQWFDHLVLGDADALSLVVSGGGPDVPTDASNIVWRAAVAMARAAGCQPKVDILLEKEIPTRSGLGGGSSDAAATLLGLNRLWRLDWPVERLAPIAAELGSDVSAFLRCSQAVIRGRGERVEYIPSRWRGWLALIVPRYPLSTADVYARWDAAAGGTPASATDGREPWTGPCEHGVMLAGRLFNDLEAAAFAAEPRLGLLHAALNGLGGRPARMTGSGSCLFALFDTASEAQNWRQAAERMLRDGERVVVVETM